MSGAVAPDSALSDRYLIERELGRGGMGVVYLAQDLRHNRRAVAIKFLPAELANAVGAARFDQEIQTLAGFNHPHILALYDSGEVDGELYYVMPRVEGESLRERLDREGPLRVRAALQLARQVVDALAYAHAAGVVHRDIKPENILLDRHGHAWVSDFGIARVLEASAEGSHFTSAMVRLGSPPYMSPEQIAGEARVDGRSDLYSFGCVLFEMLTGEPPFADHRPQAVLRRHLIEPPPSVRDRRADIGPGLDRIVAALLAKQPEERCANADALLAALDAESARVTGEDLAPQLIARTTAPPWRRRAVLGAFATVVLLLAGWLASASDTGRALLDFSPPDSTRWLVLPLQWQAGSAPPGAGEEDALLHAAFARWQDLDVVGRAALSEQIARLDRGGTLGASAGLRIADRLNAGRSVQGLATIVGDSLEIELTLADAESGRVMRRASVRMPRAERNPVGYAILVDSLLFGRVTWDGTREADIGTSLAAARHAYGAGRAALEQWRVEQADSLFEHALDVDPGFARASLWLGQLRHWSNQSAERWSGHARFARANEAELTPRERVLAAALIHSAEGRHPDACSGYRTLLDRDERDFAAWLGLGSCLTVDDRVERDPSTASGWRFRASYHRGQLAYRRAFELEPGSFRLFQPDAFDRLQQQILFTRSSRRRTGRSADGLVFSAQPDWAGDTLRLVPWLWRDGERRPDSELSGGETALLRQRALFRDLARIWSVAHPDDAAALLAVSISLEMMGDAAALDTLLAARDHASDTQTRVELAVREVWLRVKLSAVRETDLAVARALADSILGSETAAANVEARRMAALAVLVGRPAVAAAHVRRDALTQHAATRPGSVTRASAALLVFASTGGPADSIAESERLTEAAIRNSLPAEDQMAARRELLELPAILAAPAHRLAVLADDGIVQSPLSHAHREVARGDTAAALELLDPWRDEPGGTLDMTYSAAALAAALGDTATAVANLDAIFDDVRWMQPGMIETVPHAGALVRAMALRAELAAAAGQQDQASRWARAVVALWGDGEPAVRPMVDRMRRFSR